MAKRKSTNPFRGRWLIGQMDQWDVEEESEELRAFIEVEYTSETGPFSSKTTQAKVIGLGDPGDEPMIDDTYLTPE